MADIRLTTGAPWCRRACAALLAGAAVLSLMAAVIAGSAINVVLADGAVARTGPSAALIMIEEPGCPYCERWHEEIGVGYAKSSEGRFAPLKTYFDSEPEAERFKNVVYSPTFIVLRRGREVGRIIGYPGEDFFWPMLDAILAKAGYAPDRLARRKAAR